MSKTFKHDPIELSTEPVKLALYTRQPSIDEPEVGKVTDWDTVHFHQDGDGNWVNTDPLPFIIGGGVVTFTMVDEAGQPLRGAPEGER